MTSQKPYQTFQKIFPKVAPKAPASSHICSNKGYAAQWMHHSDGMHRSHTKKPAQSAGLYQSARCLFVPVDVPTPAGMYLSIHLVGQAYTSHHSHSYMCRPFFAVRLPGMIAKLVPIPVSCASSHSSAASPVYTLDTTAVNPVALDTTTFGSAASHGPDMYVQLQLNVSTNVAFTPDAPLAPSPNYDHPDWSKPS